MCFRAKTIGVVVPAYNEELLIEDTLRSIPDYIDQIYVIDDCSTDMTSEIVHNFTKNDSRVICINLEKNTGVGGAIVTGCKQALNDGIDIIAVMAGDNQMDPDYLPNLINPIIDGNSDFTKGNRLRRGYMKGMSMWRIFGNLLLNMLTKIASGYWNIEDPQNGYIAISSQGIRKLKLDRLYKGYAFENDMMVKANVVGIRMSNVSIPARYGAEKSKINYSTFICNTSVFLLLSFLWRIWTKYMVNGQLIGIFYLIGCLGIIVGSLLLLLGESSLLVLSIIIFMLSCVVEAKIINKGV